MHASSKKVKQIKKQLESECVEQCAKRFGTTGDRTRMKICYLLRNHPELTVSDIAGLVSLSVSAVSHSLKKLREVDVVKSRKTAQKVYYSLENNEFTRALVQLLSI